MITKEQKIKIRKFAKDKPIELIYLFGSQARGKTTPLSDFDFGVLFTDSLSSSKRFNLQLELISFLTQLLGTDRVDVMDLNYKPPLARYEAFSPRNEIFVKDEGKRIDFELEALREYFDIAYYLKRHAKESLENFAKRGLGNQ